MAQAGQRKCLCCAVEENRRRKTNTFKPPSSDDFQNAADTSANMHRNTSIGGRRST